MERLAILIGARGRGSNMAALLRACADGTIPAKPLCVVAPRASTEAAANTGGVEVVVVEPGAGYGERLVTALAGATAVCLAGFTRLLPTEVLAAFPNRVLNVHPSLLPRHGGPGMYGLRVHEAVLASGDAESGCTVHLVTERYDEGRVIMQARCRVRPDDTPETLATRVLALEHRIYPEAVRRVLSGDLSPRPPLNLSGSNGRNVATVASPLETPSTWGTTPVEMTDVPASCPSADLPMVPPSARVSLQGEPSSDEVVR